MAGHFHYTGDIQGGAEKHHRHYDLEGKDDGLRQDVNSLRYRVSDLEEALREATVELARLRTLIETPTVTD